MEARLALLLRHQQQQTEQLVRLQQRHSQEVLALLTADVDHAVEGQLLDALANVKARIQERSMAQQTVESAPGVDVKVEDAQAAPASAGAAAVGEQLTPCEARMAVDALVAEAIAQHAPEGTGVTTGAESEQYEQCGQFDSVERAAVGEGQHGVHELGLTAVEVQAAESERADAELEDEQVGAGVQTLGRGDTPAAASARAEHGASDSLGRPLAGEVPSGTLLAGGAPGHVAGHITATGGALAKGSDVDGRRGWDVELHAPEGTGVMTGVESEQSGQFDDVEPSAAVGVRQLCAHELDPSAVEMQAAESERVGAELEDEQVGTTRTVPGAGVQTLGQGNAPAAASARADHGASDSLGSPLAGEAPSGTLLAGGAPGHVAGHIPAAGGTLAEGSDVDGRRDWADLQDELAAQHSRQLHPRAEWFDMKDTSESEDSWGGDSATSSEAEDGPGDMGEHEEDHQGQHDAENAELAGGRLGAAGAGCRQAVAVRAREPLPTPPLVGEQCQARVDAWHSLVVSGQHEEASEMEEYLLAMGITVDSDLQAWTGPGCAGFYGGGGCKRRRRARGRKRRAQGSGADDAQDGEDRDRTGMRAEASGLGDYAVQMLAELRVDARVFMVLAVQRLAELGAAAGLTWLADVLDVQVSTVREEAARMTATLECNGRSWDVSVVERGSRAHRKRSLWMECFTALLSAVFRQCSGGPPVSLACLRDIGMPGESAARIQAMRDL